jgi:hypothetical protein
MKSFKTFLEANETGGIFSMTPTENPEALPYHPTFNPGGYQLQHTRPILSNPLRRPKPKPPAPRSPMERFFDTAFGIGNKNTESSTRM